MCKPCVSTCRGRWLLGLLVLQSTSSFVLDAYQDLLKQHIVVTLFLTMLVGAGGNAGNQSAIKVIRGLVSVLAAYAESGSMHDMFARPCCAVGAVPMA